MTARSARQWPMTSKGGRMTDTTETTDAAGGVLPTAQRRPRQRQGRRLPADHRRLQPADVAGVGRGRAASGAGYIVRQDPPPGQAIIDTDRATEWEVLSTLHQSGRIPMPAPLWFDPTGEELGSPGIVIEMFDGEALVSARPQVRPERAAQVRAPAGRGRRRAGRVPAGRGAGVPRGAGVVGRLHRRPHPVLGRRRDAGTSTVIRSCG